MSKRIQYTINVYKNKEIKTALPRIPYTWVCVRTTQKHTQCLLYSFPNFNIHKIILFFHRYLSSLVEMDDGAYMEIPPAPLQGTTSTSMASLLTEEERKKLYFVLYKGIVSLSKQI